MTCTRGVGKYSRNVDIAILFSLNTTLIEGRERPLHVDKSNINREQIPGSFPWGFCGRWPE